MASLESTVYMILKVLGYEVVTIPLAVIKPDAASVWPVVSIDRSLLSDVCHWSATTF